MVTPNTQKIIIVLAVLLILGFLGYNLFTSTPSAAPVDSTTSLTDTEVPGQDILTLVEKLKDISIDPSIFSSPLFTDLTDYSSTISPELQGRANPFAPFGTDTTAPGNTNSLNQATSTTKGQ